MKKLSLALALGLSVGGVQANVVPTSAYCNTAYMSNGQLTDLGAADENYLFFQRYANLEQLVPVTTVEFSAFLPGNDLEEIGFFYQSAVEGDSRGFDPYVVTKVEFFHFWRQRWLTVDEFEMDGLNKDQSCFTMVDPAGLINPITAQVRTRVTWHGSGLPFSRVRVDAAWWFTGDH
ncbi:MAG TPA: hypothetical protein PKA27_07210 [Fimbriimonadaceae bacterium]|nr:hypothetical protein [Fimbriimonadaceae bacterium]